jgi:hypothetical protein
MQLSTPVKYAMFVAVALSLGFLVFGPHRIVSDPDDFRGFYCAGSAVLAHADPYLAEPLRTCEFNNTSAAGLSGFRDLALPAPLPAFALIPFMGFALLPFTQASNLFSMLLLAATVVTAVLTARITGFPIVGCIAAFVISDGTIDVLNGQPFPFALLALVASAFYLSRERPIAASIFASLAAIEPHIALPALLALAWCAPKTRIPLAISLLTLGALALVAIGPAQNIEYLVRVLPAHAKSEAYSLIGQYSLTVLLIEMGVARDLAVTLANVQYAIMVLLGCFLARKLAARADAPELLVLVPPAVAVLGGPFLHLTQIATAIPATIALAMHFPRYRTAFGIALLLLAGSWQDLVENETAAVIITLLLVTIAIGSSLWPRARSYTTIAVVCMVSLGIVERVIRLADHAVRGNPGRALALVAGPHELAEASWTAFITSSQFGDPRHHFASHLPMWIALLIMIGTMGAVVYGRQAGSPADTATAAQPS